MFNFNYKPNLSLYLSKPLQVTLYKDSYINKLIIFLTINLPKKVVSYKHVEKLMGKLLDGRRIKIISPKIY